jgi:MFS family permease
MTASILGTTLVHLKVYLNENSATLWSMALIWFSVGYLVGGLLCGILFDRYNWELLFSFSVALLSFTVGMAQMSSTFYDFLVWCTIYSIAMGYIDAGSCLYVFTNIIEFQTLDFECRNYSVVHLPLFGNCSINTRRIINFNLDL